MLETVTRRVVTGQRRGTEPGLAAGVLLRALLLRSLLLGGCSATGTLPAPTDAWPDGSGGTPVAGAAGSSRTGGTGGRGIGGLGGEGANAGNSANASAGVGGAGAGSGGAGAGGGGAGAGGGGASADGGSGIGGESGGSGEARDGGVDAPTFPPVGTTVSLDPTGKYTVTFKIPSWTFGGTLGALPTAVQTSTGSDGLGAYTETTFTYTKAGSRQGRIRAYDSTPVVVFGEKSSASVANTRNFPRLATLPPTSHHLTYSDLPFGEYTLTGLTADSPWVFFDDTANTFILSAASHFMNVETRQETGNNISTGIAAQIANLPPGFEQTTVLVADAGINRAYEDWGKALLRLGGKSPVANDATVDLANFGYWTDHGGSYYYATQAGADYQTTLKNVKTYFQQLGIPVAFVQLDSWWYPKGATNTWQGDGTSQRGGAYLDRAAPALFPNDLAPFQQSLGLPLMVHARWIDPASPYRAMYTMSNNVSIDPKFWSMVAAYLKTSGVITYEQDWLYKDALPMTNNLTDQDAFLDNMAEAMRGAGINLQYCMPLPKHYLQGTKYQNLVTTRVSNDRFDRNRWKVFLYGTRLASALGVWPWTDVFKSSERDNLLLSTLSAGMMGVGDAIGSADKASIFRAVRADGALIKPDVPILQLDRSILDEARGTTAPTIATTFSQHPGGRATYVFGFSDHGNAAMSFTPGELGYADHVYVYDVNKATGRILLPDQANTDSITDTAYYIVVPIGPSGIGFLGERGKIAPLGKKRIASWSDNGTLTVTVAFAIGETPITLQGYAPSAPTATAAVGSVGSVSFDTTTKRFTVVVTPVGAGATLSLKL